MYNIDELITEIQEHEIVDIDGEMNKEQRERIEEKVLTSIHNSKIKKFPRHKRLVVLLVATFVLLLGLTGVASSDSEWDIVLTNFMGISDADTLQLESGEVQIGASSVSKCKDFSESAKGIETEIKMIATSSIGDKNCAYIRIDTDYELPKGFDASTDSIMMEDFAYRVSTRESHDEKYSKTFASSTMFFSEEGKVGFLVEITDCEAINKSYVSLSFRNLYWHHDLGVDEEDEAYREPELLCEGDWELKWKYSYKSSVKTRRMFKKIQVSGKTYYLTKIELSPIFVRMEAVTKALTLEEYREGLDLLEEIHYKDGEVIKIEHCSAGGISNRIFLESMVNVMELGQPLQLDNISYLVIGGEKIE